MEMNIDGKRVTVDVYIDHDRKACRYDLTSAKELEPLDAALALWNVVKEICRELGVDPDDFRAESALELEEQSTLH